MKGTAAAIVVLSLGLVSCSAIDTAWDYDADFDFTTLATYDWVGIDAARNHRVNQRVEIEINRDLQEKGYAPTTQDPTFRVFVTFDFASVTGQQGSHPRTTGAFPEYFIGIGEGTNLYVSRDGSMRIDFVDPAGEKLIWRGIASGSFSARMTDEERDALVVEAIDRLMKQFPPPTK